MNGKIIIGLPAFNEEEALPKLMAKLNSLRARIGAALRIVIVNDGSTDNTEVILKEYSEKFPYMSFVSHSCNQGLGQAMKTLFEYVIEHYNGNDVLFTLDADNTHNPFIIPDMVNQLKDEKLDVIIASRFAPGGKEVGVSPLRKMYSRGAKMFFKTFFPIQNVNDYSSGFRGYSIRYLQKAIGAYGGNLITSNGFECMAEIIARFSKIGVRAAECPLVLEYHLKEGKSKMKVIRTILGYFRLVRIVKAPYTAPEKKADNWT